MATDTRLRLALEPRREALEPARLAVLEHLAPADPSPALVYRLELVLEEVLMNIVWHAGPVQAIALEVEARAAEVVLSFEDDGAPFDPTHAVPPAQPHDLAEAVPGGLGLVLLRKFASSLAYERAGRRNRLTVTLARA